MADLNADLKSYLSKSKNGGGSNNPGTRLKSVTSWFSSRSKDEEPYSADEEPLVSEQDSTNGWFNQAQKDSVCPTLSKKQRILGFMFLLLAGLGCFVLAWLFLPILPVKPRKFALLYTLGSLFTIGSFSILWGPTNHIKHLCSYQRFPFTAIYFGTIFATLYFVFVKKNTLLTLICSICQLIALVWYLVSYIPGGQTGLSFFTKLFATVAGKTISNTMPVWEINDRCSKVLHRGQFDYQQRMKAWTRDPIMAAIRNEHVSQICLPVTGMQLPNCLVQRIGGLLQYVIKIARPDRQKSCRSIAHTFKKEKEEARLRRVLRCLELWTFCQSLSYRLYHIVRFV